ncbi:hypothetical protein K4A85_07555 [Bacillus pumilus]|nr:hypothetical protein K4A85_07555 [Bacillus pumilus]WOP23287.1 hypothetical protein R0I01_07675 [Bacillus pumilus]
MSQQVASISRTLNISLLNSTACYEYRHKPCHAGSSSAAASAVQPKDSDASLIDVRV